MDDRELLELAANAAGINIHCMLGNTIMRYTCMGNMIAPWNPITNDGDAFRLAVKLNLDITFSSEPDGPEVIVDADWLEGPILWQQPLSKDPYAATRRAIVRAAAELGETKSKELTP